MILISKSERDELERVGLLKYKRVGINAQDANFQVVNREHCSRDKATYVTEEAEIMSFLGKYDNLNLQRVSRTQFEQLKTEGFITEENFQKWGEYVPKAIAFEDSFGQKRIKKITKMMVFLNIWKGNRSK